MSVYSLLLLTHLVINSRVISNHTITDYT